MATLPTKKEYKQFFKHFGNRVRNLRLEKKMVQEDLLDYGFSTRHYQRIEAGLPINVKTAIRLCKAFEIKLSKLFEGL